VDVLDRVAVLVLGGGGTPDGNERLARRVRHEMEMKVPLCSHGPVPVDVDARSAL
jgi:hypothetical protein